MLYFKLFKEQIVHEYPMSEISTYWLFIAIALGTMNFQIALCFGEGFRWIPIRGEVMLEEMKSLLEAGGVEKSITHNTNPAH